MPKHSTRAERKPQENKTITRAALANAEAIKMLPQERQNWIGAVSRQLDTVMVADDRAKSERSKLLLLMHDGVDKGYIILLSGDPRKIDKKKITGKDGWLQVSLCPALGMIWSKIKERGKRDILKECSFVLHLMEHRNMFYAKGEGADATYTNKAGRLYVNADKAPKSIQDLADEAPIIPVSFNILKQAAVKEIGSGISNDNTRSTLTERGKVAARLAKLITDDDDASTMTAEDWTAIVQASQAIAKLQANRKRLQELNNPREAMQAQQASKAQAVQTIEGSKTGTDNK